METNSVKISNNTTKRAMCSEKSRNARSNNRPTAQVIAATGGHNSKVYRKIDAAADEVV